jgi:hypothetical protein
LHLTPKTLDLGLLRLNPPVTWKRFQRIGSEVLHPLADDVLVHVEIASRLRDADTPVSNQTYRLNLELFGKTPPSHDVPPASSYHPN